MRTRSSGFNDQGLEEKPTSKNSFPPEQPPETTGFKEGKNHEKSTTDGLRYPVVSVSPFLDPQSSFSG